MIRALSDAEMNSLATYNAEIRRGLIHQGWWRAEMAALQNRFDAQHDDNWCMSHNQSRGACRTGSVDGACLIGSWPVAAR